jgi:hypothetical protein
VRAPVLALERERLLRERGGGDHRRRRVYRRDDQLARGAGRKQLR